MSRNPIQYLFLAALTCSLAGCATTGARTGYLKEYDQLKAGQYLRGFHAEPGFSSAVSSVRVAAVDTSKVGEGQPTYPDEPGVFFRNALRSAAQGYGAGSFFVFEEGAPADAALEVALTEITTGSRLGRVLAGELGAGHAYVQVEGRVVAPDGKVWASFSERRRSSGIAGARDTFEDSGPTLVREMLVQLANGIVQEFKVVRSKSSN